MLLFLPCAGTVHRIIAQIWAKVGLGLTYDGPACPHWSTGWTTPPPFGCSPHCDSR